MYFDCVFSENFIFDLSCDKLNNGITSVKGKKKVNQHAEKITFCLSTVGVEISKQDSRVSLKYLRVGIKIQGLENAWENEVGARKCMKCVFPPPKLMQNQNEA